LLSIHIQQKVLGASPAAIGGFLGRRIKAMNAAITETALPARSNSRTIRGVLRYDLDRV